MKIIQTAKNKGFGMLKTTRSENVTDVFHLNILDQTDQVIQGFGGAFTEASAYNLSRVNKALRQSMLEAYFDPMNGAGYTMGRLSINSCDFGLTSYDYVKPYDESLESFDISRDQHIIDLILDASKIAGKKLKLIASPWSPPFWMKDNLKMIQGGSLLPKHYDLWAQYIIKFLKAYQEKGVEIEAISIQNEPLATQRWESCVYDHEQEKNMVICLGRVFKEAKMDTKIYIWDHNRDVMYARANHILSDEEARTYVYGIAFHWYDQNQFEEVLKTHQAFPQKHLLFTEGCQEYGPHIGSYEVGERYGLNMMKDIHHGTEGYIDWNLFLDTTGGPNHVNNLCSSPIIVDVFPEEMITNPSFHYVSHFSKYVKEGAIRYHSHMESDVLHNVFKNKDGSYVVVLLNHRDDGVEIHCNHHAVTFKTTMDPHSIQTIIL